MIKCQAHYRVTIYSNENTVTITDPITCHFNVTRGVMSDCNKATIQLYNLAPETREKIFQDAFTFEPEQWKYVHLEAGYGDRLSLIFKGRILQAYSRKSGGQTDVITEIQAQALDMFDCDSSYCFKAGTSKRDAFQTMALDMPNVKLANMGALEGVFQTDTTFDGNTMDCLNQLTGGNTFVDNGNLNCVMLNEVIDVPVPVITDDSCLLETPMRRDANLEIKMLFEPSLITAQLLEIKSGVAPNFNGQYKVLGFTHDCTISGSQGGTRITTANLYIGPMLPQPEVNTTDGKVQNNFNKVKGDTVTPVNPTSTRQKWIMPVKGYPITSGYGNRLHPVYKVIKFHDGIDIGTPLNTPVKACADGKVSVSRWIDGYGNYIQIEHSGKLSSFYAHLSYRGVKVGQIVKQGQIIGKSGNTGIGTGSHLHFGAKKNGRTANPLNYVRK